MSSFGNQMASWLFGSPPVNRSSFLVGVRLQGLLPWQARAVKVPAGIQFRGCQNNKEGFWGHYAGACVQVYILCIYIYVNVQKDKCTNKLRTCTLWSVVKAPRLVKQIINGPKKAHPPHRIAVMTAGMYYHGFHGVCAFCSANLYF